MRQPRASQRYLPIVRDDELPLTKRIIELACMYGRYGYRRVTALLRWDGWFVNHKRVERIRKKEGLKVPRKQRKRGRLWFNDGSCVRLRPQHKDDVWSYDFVFDRTEDGRRLKLLTVVDEFSRECLAIEVGRRIRATQVLDVLTGLMIERGTPCFIRSDNGPEFIARKLRRWLDGHGVRTLFIEPGSPWQNAYVESFNGKFRDECLNMEWFRSRREACVIIEKWRVEYNQVRPHSALNNLTPEAFRRQRELKDEEAGVVR